MKDDKVIKAALKQIIKQEKPKLALDVEGVVDILDAGDHLVYLTDQGEAVDSVIVDGTTYTPPAKNEVPYLFADKEKVLRLICDSSDSSDSSLYTPLRLYHEAISDLPVTEMLDLLVIWDIHTYFIEKLHFSPILYLFAVKERGKSRTGKGCLYVARRGVFTETVREPDIIRWGNDHRAALGFDVKDFPKKIERANCDDLILARFEKGSVSSRTLWPEKGAFRDTKTFKLFGPTIVMTNRPVDDILESRAISIDMKPSIRVFNDPVLPENALDLKARLTAFRFKHKDTKLKKLDKPLPGRLGDILSPLQQIVYTFFPEKVDTFNALVRLIDEKKKEEAVDTFEARIVEAVLSAESKVEEGFLPIEVIASIFNEGKDEKFAVRNETIGRVLRGLGFASRRGTSGKRGIYYDLELVNSVSSQYGLRAGVCKSLSLPSLPPRIEATPDNKFENFELGSDL